jgi:deoxyribodipyrimidine photo-lyase
MSRILIWYRNDLRLHDHEPLHQALAEQAQIIPVYCWDSRLEGTTSYGFPKTGRFRAKFLAESLLDLRTNLQNVGSDLILRQGKTEDVLPQLAQELEIDRIYYHAEVTSEELAVEKSLKNALIPLNISLTSFWGHTLFHPDDLPFTIHQIPELFTQFRKIIEKQTRPRPIFPTPIQLPALPPIPMGDLPIFLSQSLHPQSSDRRGGLTFIGGENQGIERLTDYFWRKDCLKTYKETRNGMLGADYSSKFSPWLALGCLSPRYIYNQVKTYEQERIANDSTYWLIFELLWRDYFRFIAAKHGDCLFRPSGLRGIRIPWQENWDSFQRWQEGLTGYPLVDANMRELAATGFMSNRGRQNVASFLTKNLGLSWQMGAEWFESCLLDYDVCSNWGNWNYTAGIGNDAREFRYFNITKQSRDYDPQGDYLRHWLPELARLPGDKIHDPSALSQQEQKEFCFKIGEDYPRPIVDFFESVNFNKSIYQTALNLASR